MPKNINKCCEKFYEKLGFAIHKENGLIYSQTYIASPFLNGVIACEGIEENLEKSYLHICSHFEKNSLPFSWWLEESASNSALHTFLEKKGYKSVGDFPGMAHSLTNIPALSHINLQRVTTKSDFQKWSHIICKAFGMTEEIAQCYSALFETKAHEGTFIHLMNLEGQRALSVGTLLITEDVGYIYNIATLPDVQQKGFAAAVVSGLLREAKEKMCSQVVLQSSPIAIKLYKNLGFEVKNSFKIYV